MTEMPKAVPIFTTFRPDAEPTYRLLFYSDVRIGFEHPCGDRGVRAPVLAHVGQSGGHRIIWFDHPDGRQPPTVNPSILCPDCGLHGHIINGVWT